MVGSVGIWDTSYAAVFDEAVVADCPALVVFVVGSAQAASATAEVATVSAARIFVVCMVMFLSICIGGAR